MKKYRIFVFANLKPSQIEYKIIPLSMSEMVEHVYVLRKEPLAIQTSKITCLYLPSILRLRPFYWFFTALFGILKIKKFKTNLILNYNIFPHGFNAFVASKILNQPAIFSEINEDTMIYFHQKIPHLLVKQILNNASVICTPGSNTAKFWNNYGYSKTTFLHSTIDTEKFIPKSNISKKYDFIFIGTLDNNKRADIIIKAFSIIKNTHNDLKLCIIGFGEQELIIKEQIRSLRLENNIVFIKTNSVIDYLQCSKIFVMASLSEGIPCAMMEAMACGLIVVVPPVGDIADVVQHKVNGYLHDNTEEDIVKWMKTSYENYKEVESLREKARETIVVNHSYDSATIKWNNLLSKM